MGTHEFVKLLPWARASHVHWGKDKKHGRHIPVFKEPSLFWGTGSVSIFLYSGFLHCLYWLVISIPLTSHYLKSFILSYSLLLVWAVVS